MDQRYSNHYCLLGLAFVVLSLVALSAPPVDDAILLQQSAIAR